MSFFVIRVVSVRQFRSQSIHVLEMVIANENTLFITELDGLDQLLLLALEVTLSLVGVKRVNRAALSYTLNTLMLGIPSQFQFLNCLGIQLNSSLLVDAHIHNIITIWSLFCIYLQHHL